MPTNVNYLEVVHLLNEIVSNAPDNYAYPRSEGWYRRDLDELFLGPGSLYHLDLPDPEYVYLGGAYVYDNRPSCIIGHLFAKLGVSIDYLKGAEGLSAKKVLRNLIASGELSTPDQHAIEALIGEVQFWQDRGDTWEESVKRGIN